MSSSTTSSSTEYHHSTTTTTTYNNDDSNNPSNTLKCPCCNNPWSVATSEIFSKLCAECTTTATTTNTADNDNDNNNDKKMNLKKYLDESISPTLDFYHYANGSWLQENPIPAGYPSWNTFLQLHTLSQERLKDLLLLDNNNNNDNDNDNDKKNTTTTNYNEIEMKVKTFYNAAMDEESIELESIGPLKDVLTLCDDIANVAIENNKNKKEEVASCLGKLLSNYGISSFFSIGKI